MTGDERKLIILPTYNEVGNIQEIIPLLIEQDDQIDIVVVDDDSPDKTATVVEKMQKKYSNLFLIKRSAKLGLGTAYVAGFRYALKGGYDIIFEMDADFSHDPQFLPQFLKAIKTNDLVIGSRYKTGVNIINWPMSRLMLSYYSNQYVRLITGIPVRDSTGGFKCFRRSLLEKLPLDKISSSGYSFQIEINHFAWKNGFRISEIPIVFTDRKLGTSKMSTNIILEALFLIWKLKLASIFHRK